MNGGQDYNGRTDCNKLCLLCGPKTEQQTWVSRKLPERYEESDDSPDGMSFFKSTAALFCALGHWGIVGLDAGRFV